MQDQHFAFRATHLYKMLKHVCVEKCYELMRYIHFYRM